ncbi:MAG TPA: hypothetical protein PKK56_02005 [archaeon]|jgi:tRNA threonylcarbamoyladenosine modification (KEOPS) complex  Pcc1 subunit|nr:hypothetical protein [archaeon]HRT02405.1 hypothetical protein [Candidatus Diapherotrites archaeon]
MIQNIISSEIKIMTQNPEKLKKLLEIEMKRKEYNRSDSKITIDKNKKTLTIKIYAKDIIAYKACINNYINLLELIKKIYEVNL